MFRLIKEKDFCHYSHIFTLIWHKQLRLRAVAECREILSQFRCHKHEQRKSSAHDNARKKNVVNQIWMMPNTNIYIYTHFRPHHANRFIQFLFHILICVVIIVLSSLHWHWQANFRIAMENFVAMTRDVTPNIYNFSNGFFIADFHDANSHIITIYSCENFLENEWRLMEF